jgi:hypothetical protein
MTGAEHYAEAERLVAIAAKDRLGPYPSLSSCALVVGLAQVHATLALAAATDLNRALGAMDGTAATESTSAVTARFFRMRISACMDLHQRTPVGELCVEDGQRWPCATSVAMGYAR